MTDKGEYAKNIMVIEPAMNGGFIVREDPRDCGRLSSFVMAFTNRRDLLEFLVSEYSTEPERDLAPAQKGEK